VEVDGPGSETLPAATYEPQKLAAVYTGHIARHIPASEDHLWRVRGSYSGAGVERVLPGVPREPDDKVSEEHKTVQGQQGAYVRRIVVWPTQPHPIFTHILAHGGRAQSSVPQWHVLWRQLSHHKERRWRMVETHFSGEVLFTLC